MDERRNRAFNALQAKLLEHKELEAQVKQCMCVSIQTNFKVRKKSQELKKKFDKTEDDLKALQSVGQIIGEVLRQLDEERCKCDFACCSSSCSYFESIKWSSLCCRM